MSAGTAKVISPGALSLVQDAGRLGYQKFGVSLSGAMDTEALLLGNRLVGNSPDCAAVEITFGGAELEFSQETVIAVTGGDLDAKLDGTPVPAWESFRAPAGSSLVFGGPAGGMRAYVCAAGGIATEPVLGSRSTHAGSGLGGLDGGPLKAGDELPIGEPSDEPSALRIPNGLLPHRTSQLTLGVVPGPQQDAFTGDGVSVFYSSEYTVTDRSDRQGVRLDGPVIQAVGDRYDIVSDAVVFGSVQVPGDGKPIVLLADRQTTGGYAKIGVVASVSLPALAQAAPGTTARFERMTVQDAQAAARKRMSDLLETPLEDASPARAFSLNVSGQIHEIRLPNQPDPNTARTIQVDINGEIELVAVEAIGD